MVGRVWIVASTKKKMHIDSSASWQCWSSLQVNALHSSKSAYMIIFIQTSESICTQFGNLPLMMKSSRITLNMSNSGRKITRL